MQCRIRLNQNILKLILMLLDEKLLKLVTYNKELQNQMDIKLIS